MFNVQSSVFNVQSYMKLTGRRESSNVEDRRGLSGGAKAGIGGIGAIIVAALFAWISGGDPVSAGLQAAQQQMQAKTESVNPEEFTEEEQQLATECKQILASTEDVWGKVFQQMGRTYEPPTLVLFTNQVSSACGSATAAVGPFYCSGDQKLYIDLSFFTQMKRQNNRTVLQRSMATWRRVSSWPRPSATTGCRRRRRVGQRPSRSPTVPPTSVSAGSAEATRRAT